MYICVASTDPFGFLLTLLTLIGRVNICCCSQRSSVRGVGEAKAFEGATTVEESCGFWPHD